MTQKDRLFFTAAGCSVILIGAVCMLAGITFLRAVFIAVNAATLLAYGYDKYAAGSSVRRVPEYVLHIMAAAGGTPGAFVGQQIFRHKTRKSCFRTVFLLIAATQLVLLIIFTVMTK